MSAMQELDAASARFEPERSPLGSWRVIPASPAGTMIEWYDFFIFGSLATIFATQF